MMSYERRRLVHVGAFAGDAASGLQARVDRLPVLAHAALDLATPQESAVAPLGHQGLVGLVAAAAAHQVAPVHADGRLVAGATVRAQYAQARVRVAEPGRRFQVHQVLGAGRLQVRVVRFQLEVVPVPAAAAPPAAPAAAAVLLLLLLLLLFELRLLLRVLRLLLFVMLVLRVVLAPQPAQTARVAHHHPGRAVEPVLEVVADRTEYGQSHPARLHGARARHAVTLALLFHLRLYVLKH